MTRNDAVETPFSKKRKRDKIEEDTLESNSSGGSSDIMMATASNQDLIVSIEERLTSATGKKVALLSISNKRPDTVLGKEQGDHVTAYRSFIEMLITAVEGSSLSKAGIIILNTFKALLPGCSSRFDKILERAKPLISNIPSSSMRKKIIQDLRDTGNYNDDFLINHNEMMKSCKRSLLMSIVREAGQEFIKQINLDEETAFRKEGASDKGEGARVKKAIHGLKAVNDLKAIFDESDFFVKETRMDRFYEKYIKKNAPYKDGANAVFTTFKVKLLNKNWSSILDENALLNTFYTDLNKDKIGDLFGDLFDFKYDSHAEKPEASDLLYRVTTKHIVTMFRAFDKLQSFSEQDKQQIVDQFLEKSILQEQGWSKHTKIKGRTLIDLSTLKQGVDKFLNLKEYRIYSKEEMITRQIQNSLKKDKKKDKPKEKYATSQKKEDSKKMTTTYKNFTKLERYIEALKGEYYQEYPELTLEQIRRPIYLVAEWVNSDANKPSSEKIKMFAIDDYKQILKDKEQTKEDGLEESVLGALYFLIKIEESVRYLVSKCGKIPFPEEHKEIYLDFVSKMTERVVRDMCDTLENRISYAGKMKYWKLIGKEPEENKLQNSTELFVEKISGTKRSISDEQQPFSKKFKSKKVSFAEHNR